jgi:hypothetical protein
VHRIRVWDEYARGLSARNDVGATMVETRIEEPTELGACSVVAAAGRGLQRRVSRRYKYAFRAHHLVSVGCLHAVFHCYRSHIAMQCNGGWDGKL